MFKSKKVAFSTVIPFDKGISVLPLLTISAPVVFTKKTLGAKPGNGAILPFVCDGVNLPDFTDFKLLGGAVKNFAGKAHTAFFLYDGQNYGVAFSPLSNITAGSSIGVSGSLDYLTLSDNTGYSKTGNIFYPTVNNGAWGNLGLDVKKLAAGADGFVQAFYTDNTCMNCFLGLSPNNVKAGYASMNAALYIGADCWGFVDRGGSGGDVTNLNGGALSYGQGVRVSRSGGVLKLQKIAADGETVLGDLHTYSYTFTGNMYATTDIFGAGKLSEAKGQNLS